MKNTGRKLNKILFNKGNELYHVVSSVLKNKRGILNLASKHKTPFYVFDQKALNNSINLFLNSFKKELPSFRAYYAMKINHHPFIIKYAVEKGLGLDVGSPREIDMAIEAGCKDILYFSPGKTEDDLKHAIKYSSVITINMDSFSELDKLGRLTNHLKTKIKAGIRVHTNLSGDWKKYGIHITDLKKFWEKAEKYPFIDLSGIHFHMSRNKDAYFYENTIKELGTYLKNKIKTDDLRKIKYIDFGGGFEVYESEGIIQKTKQGHDYLVRDAIKIEAYAKKISTAIRTHLSPILDITYYSEPGRIICNDSMFVVLSVVDKKDDNNVVLDGGVNMVGWQRFEYEYFPLVNISNSSKKEIECNMWGNLCTTWDIWGYRCYSKKIREGDFIVVPNQGALTYSLAQNFIQPIPLVYEL